MSVDKFGRTDNNVIQKVVTGGGVALTQANNIFLRRDGTSSLDGDLHMNGKWIKGLPTIYIPIGRGEEGIIWAQAAALVRDVSGRQRCKGFKLPRASDYPPVDKGKELYNKDVKNYEKRG